MGRLVRWLLAPGRRGREAARGRQEGATLLEVVVALLLAGTVLSSLIAALGSVILGSARLNDRATLLVLAKTQLEDTLIQPFQPSATASYPIIAQLPVDYGLSISVTKPVAYTYAAPSSLETPEVVQQVTVTATGRYTSFTLEGFKVRR